MLRKITAFFYGLLMQVFPSFGFKGMIDTQINVYGRLKEKFPDATEDNLLNSLILNRIHAPCSPTSTAEEVAHYNSILCDDRKTLEDVIWAIVEYECLLSCKEELQRKLAHVGAKPSDVTQELARWRKYLNERVKEIAI